MSKNANLAILNKTSLIKRRNETGKYNHLNYYFHVIKKDNKNVIYTFNISKFFQIRLSQ